MASCTSTATPTSPASPPTVAITCTQGTLAAGNYDFTTFVDGALSVTKAHLSVKADDKIKPYDGNLFTAFTATISGFVNGETLLSSGVTGAPSFSGNATTAINPGTYVITAASGTLSAANYDFPPGAFTDGTLTISYGVCSATTGPGNVILPPINIDGTSVYNRKGGSTIPVKFRVCDAAGRSISNAAAVFAQTGATLTMLSAVRGTIDSPNEAGITDVPDVAFRFDGSQWIFNLGTSNLTAGNTYTFRINLLYGPPINFVVGVK
jgi:hypothetical protein